MKRRSSRHSTGDVAVVLTCSRCGRRITLVAGPVGAVLADRDAFVRTHQACLRATDPPLPGGSGEIWP